MKKHSIRRGLTFALSVCLAIQTPLSGILPVLTGYAAVGSATVGATNLNVRSGPGITYSQIGKLPSGTAVNVVGETTGSDGRLWYQIQYDDSSGSKKTGYVLSTYINFTVNYQYDADFEAYLMGQGFPESYKSGLRELHARYPSWIFQAQKIDLDWSVMIENQSLVGRNLVSADSISSWKSTMDGAYDWGTGSWPGFDGSSWVAASKELISYYVDPRNFLDPIYIFQFLSHTYDAGIQNSDGLRVLTTGTFLADGISSSSGGSESRESAGYGPGFQSDSGAQNSSESPTEGTKAPSGGGDEARLQAPGAAAGNTGISASSSGYGPGENGNTTSQPKGASESSAAGSIAYVDVLMQAAVQSGVNPYVLAAMIIQEQGREGTSDSISGTASGYPGYYNYYNIGAYQSGNNTAVTQGLSFASQSGSYLRPWNTREKSLIGGAQYYGENYVKAGQDSFYLKKFNVKGENLYKNQYMTNVQGAASEAALCAEGYSESLRQTAMVFKIPVYSNMPEQACSKPSLDGSPNNKLSDLIAAGFSLTPTFSRDINSYDLIVDHSVTNVSISANAIDSASSITGTGTIPLQEGINAITVNVTAGNGSVRAYKIHVVRRNNGSASDSKTGSTESSGSTEGSGNSGIIVEPKSNTGNQTDAALGRPGGDSVIIISPTE